MGRPKLNRTKICESCQISFDLGSSKNSKKNCSKECLDKYNLLHKGDRMKKTFSAIKEKYGVDSFFKSPGFYENVKQIKKDKHGDENYNNYDQIKSTLKKNHNVEHPSLIDNYDQKSKTTKELKYGDKNFNNREQAKITIQEKYNVDHHLQSKEILDKQKSTNQEKYGVDYTIQTKESKDALLKHNQKKYNADYFFSSNTYKNTQKFNNIEKLKDILKNNDLTFDLNEYNKLRIKLESGKLQYGKYQLTCNLCQIPFSCSFDQLPVCRNCYPLTSISKQQADFKLFLQGLNIEFVENTKKIINPLELDFYLKDHNLAFELNGNYYHSELSGKDHNYHLNKTKKCNEIGIQLIHIFEDEWMYKKDIVKSRIKNQLNLSENKIFARKCEIKLVTFLEKKQFLEDNHLQGNDISYINYGLYYKNELVSIMTFSKPRLALGFNSNSKKGNSMELSRFCSKINYNIVGSFLKLLTYFKNTNPNILNLYTYADCRWSGVNPENTVYSKCGFKFIHKSKPSYFYVFKNNYLTRFHRFNFNKQKLIKLFNSDNTLSEWVIAQNNKMDRIWDCGSMKFELDF